MACPLRIPLRKVLFFVCLTSCVSAQSADDAIQRYSEEGSRALAQGHYNEAEQAYERLRELQPGVAEVHANLGLIYFQERKFEQAVPELRRALKLKPSLAKTGIVLSMSLSELGHYTEALPGLEKGFRQSSDPEIKRMCGLQLERAYTGLQRDSKAVEVALELNRLYPNDPEILYHNGKVFGNFAFLSMQKLARAAPGSIWRHQAEAEANESQGSYDSAISEYRQVLALDAQRPGIHYRLGRTLLARSRQTTSADDVAAAANEFRQELEIDPANGNAAYEIAEIDRNSGKLEDAQKLFELALKYYPDFEEAHLGLASVLASQQKPDLALAHLQRAISLNRENEVSWYRLSQVEGILGNSAEQQKAMAEFQRLHSQKTSQQESAKKLFTSDEVTKQQLDATVPK